MEKKYKLEYGVLICPNCQRQGMNKYSLWSSRLINEYTKQCLFYNKIKKRRGWKCWSIFGLCDKKIKNWYDPGNCCFNPCSGGTNICVGLLKVIFIYFLFGFIYLGYIFLFLWFDIFYCFFYKEKFYEILMPNGEDKTILKMVCGKILKQLAMLIIFGRIIFQIYLNAKDVFINRILFINLFKTKEIILKLLNLN